MLAFWLGGASAGPHQPGYRSMLGWWLGGGSSYPYVQPPIPPQVDLAGIPFPWMRTAELRALFEELKEADEEELPVLLACAWIVLWHDLN
jgi:hypothetical protein